MGEGLNLVSGCWRGGRKTEGKKKESEEKGENSKLREESGTEEYT